MINYLVKIKDGPFANRLGILRIQNPNEYCIFFNLKMEGKWFKKDKVKILSNEPILNNFYTTNFCYWCNGRLKNFVSNSKIKNKYYYTYYCPKCLR